MLWGPWTIPPGDTAIVAIISVGREEAAERMVTIEAILVALGVTHEKKAQAQQIHIPERRAAFAVKTCSLTGTIGFTSIAIFCDEQAKWKAKEEGANPAAQVMATLRPTMATQPLAFEIDCSAPWGTDDYHAQLCDLGTNPYQVYDHAASWEANPTLTEERTRALEADEREWRRAYAAIPDPTLSGDWFGAALDRVVDLPRCDEPVLPWVKYTLTLDLNFARQHLAYVVISSRTLPPDPRSNRKRRLTRVHESGVWSLDGAVPSEVAFKLRAGVCKRFNIGDEDRSYATIDEEAAGFVETARQAGLVLTVVPWTGKGIDTEIARYRAAWVAMHEGAVQFADEPAAFAELRAVRSHVTAAGNETIELPRTKKIEGGKMGPCCRVPAIVLGVSEALRRGAQAEPVQKTPETEQEKARAAAVKEIVDRRRREWQKSPEHSMRQRMARMH